MQPLNLNEVQLLLSPIYNKKKGTLNYCSKAVKVFLERIRFFIKDLFQERKIRWRNNAYFGQWIAMNPHLDDNDTIRKLLKKRKVTIVDQTFLLEHINSCDATKALYDLAQKTLKDCKGLDLKITMVSKDESKGFTDLDTGEISINSSLKSNEALSVFVFELGNVTYYKRFRDLIQQVIDQKCNRWEYGAKMEEIENDTKILHDKTVQEARKEKGEKWLKVKLYGKPLPKKLDLLFMIITGHTGFYYRAWGHIRLLKQNPLAAI